MLEKIENIQIEYDNIVKKLAFSNISKNHKEYNKLIKNLKLIEPIVFNFKEYKKTKKEITDLENLLQKENDKIMLEMILEEINCLKEKKENLERKIKIFLLPKDIKDNKNVIIEIRAGAGGNEATLFVVELFRMYSKFSENNNWKIDILNSHENGVGGYKEIIFSIYGKNVYSKLKYESGVHRVQRIPITESGGRIHTSTVTVAVLAEAEEIDIQINQAELRIDLFCSSGPGGQSVNTTQSAVRVTHIPTNIVVSCQDEKSQHKNKEKAIKVLRARLYDKIVKEEENKISIERKNQVGTGDRSERIRTYNYPQNRVTDHRVSLTLHSLDKVLEGNLKDIIESLINYKQKSDITKLI